MGKFDTERARKVSTGELTGPGCGKTWAAIYEAMCDVYAIGKSARVYVDAEEATREYLGSSIETIATSLFGVAFKRVETLHPSALTIGVKTISGIDIDFIHGRYGVESNYWYKLRESDSSVRLIHAGKYHCFKDRLSLIAYFTDLQLKEEEAKELDTPEAKNTRIVFTVEFTAEEEKKYASRSKLIEESVASLFHYVNENPTGACSPYQISEGISVEWEINPLDVMADGVKKDGKSDLGPDTERPPMGIVPRYIMEENRLAEIGAAMERYAKARMAIPATWVNEYNELVEKAGRMS